MQFSKVLLLLILTFPFRGLGFALLGPLQSWQAPSLGYSIGGNIGGPQNLGEGYRWNTPVITYDFDPSFIEYFGEAGVAAVQKAIELFNAVPPVSQIDLTNAPTHCLKLNLTASAQNLLDLKSYSMGMLQKRNKSNYLQLAMLQYVATFVTSHVSVRQRFSGLHSIFRLCLFSYSKE